METTDEKDIKKNINTEANVFTGPVDEKTYSIPPAAVRPSDVQGEIPEVQFAPPPMGDKGKNPFLEDEKDKQSAAAKKEAPPLAANPQLQDLPPAQKQEAAEILAETALKGYEKLHQLANWGLKISDRKIFKLQTKGEIDLATPIPYDNTGAKVPLGVFIQEYNQQIGDTLSVDPKWRAEVKPILTRVLAKRGHGMSDEQQLAYLVAEDAISKAVVFVQMKRQTGDILAFAREQTAASRQPPPVYAAPPPPPPPPPVQPQQQQPVYEQRAATPLDLQMQHTGANAPAGYFEQPAAQPVAPQPQQQTHVAPPPPPSQPVQHNNVPGAPNTSIDDNGNAQPKTGEPAISTNGNAQTNINPVDEGKEIMSQETEIKEGDVPRPDSFPYDALGIKKEKSKAPKKKAVKKAAPKKAANKKNR